MMMIMMMISYKAYNKKGAREMSGKKHDYCCLVTYEIM